MRKDRRLFGIISDCFFRRKGLRQRNLPKGLVAQSMSFVRSWMPDSF